MMRFLLLFCAVFCGPMLFSQVTIQNDMPTTIGPNTEITVQVKITKGAVVNFAKYQMDVPAGVIVKENDNNGGTFEFDNNRAKIIWTNISADVEITISMKLSPGAFSGPATIGQKFYYMEDGTKKEAEAPPLQVTFTGDGSKKAALSSPAQQQSEIMQAEQLKKDSKDAYQTGLKEKEAAEKKLAEADEALKKAQAIQNEEERKAALDKANAKKVKAENDKAVASKILMLAKSLDDNANEIERLNHGSIAATGTATTGSAATTAAVPDNGMVYRLQLGAFSQNPEKVLYKHMGTISIVNEGGMYKVLMGKYPTREEAVKKRDEMVKRSFDCFIVTYKDGVRVK